jgi:hypothetical protein
MTTFNDELHHTLMLTGSSLTQSEKIRVSELTLAALKATGLLDIILIQSSAPGDTGKLWLDTTTDPNTLKVHNGSTWARATTNAAWPKIFAAADIDGGSF